jgi:cell division transport system permease protein
MQLVGATSGHIRWPFLMHAFFQGIISALVGLALLLTLFYALNNILETFQISYTPTNFIILLGSLIGIGVFITVISTWFALNKYLRMKLDDLY